MNLGEDDVERTLNDNIDLDFFRKYEEYFSEGSPYEYIDIECKYYTENSFFNEHKKSQNSLILNLNIQSLSSKFEPLKELLNISQNNNVLYEIITMQEIWKIVNPEAFNIPGYKFVYTDRKQGQGGGCGMFIRDNILFRRVEKYSIFYENVFESICIECTLPCNKKILILSLYRPNTHKVLNKNQQIESFLSTLTDLLYEISSAAFPAYIFSDSNIDLLKLSDKFPAEYFDILISLGFILLVNKATRFENQSHTAIDHIFTNDNLAEFKAGVIIDSISDHFLTFLEVGGSKPKNKKKLYNTQNFSQAKILDFKRAIEDKNWDNVYHAVCPNIAFNNFQSAFNNLYNEHFPVVSKKINKNYEPINCFMTPGLLISRRTKNKLQRKAKCSPTLLNVNKNKLYRNIYNKVLKQSKKMYFNNKIDQAKSSPKNMWKIINEALNRKSSSSDQIEKILNNGDFFTDSKEIADIFNEYFSLIGHKTAETVEQTKATFDNFLPPSNLESFFILPLLQEDVIKIINAKEGKKSRDINEISTFLVKNVSWQVAPLLSHIFNLSIETGIFPDNMKTSKTVPVYKGRKAGLPTSINAYRPISLVDNWSSIFEKAISDQLILFLNRSNFFCEQQFGFRQGRSTSQAALLLVDFVSKAINNGDYIMGIFLDIRKAFDCVNHNILFAKLENLGIRGIVLQWFKSFFSGRKQKVKVNGAWSQNIKDIDISVLQGSILGVLLFLVFVNDFPRSTDLMSIIYADDSNCLCRDTSLVSLKEFVQTELQKISCWFKANKLALSMEKTKYMLFSPRHVTSTQDFSIYFNTNDFDEMDADKVSKLIRVPNAKEKTICMLGLNLDDRLSFKLHVDHIRGKIASSLYSLNKVKNLLDKKALKSIYYALIHSHLNYCCLIYNCATDSSLSCLIKLQKRAIRVVSKAKYNSHSGRLFKELNILPLKQLIDFNILLFMYDVENNILPPSLCNIFSRNVNEQYNLRNANDYFIHRHKFEYLKKFPFILFPLKWDNFEMVSKTDPNRLIFKNALKQHLLDSITIESCTNTHCRDCFPLNLTII